jgi:putative FmdB family regulatory protein
VPIYEYLCEGCGRISELMQKMSDPPPRSCPECGSRKIAKLVSRTAFQLKGGGWYADLYSSAKKDGKAATGGGAAEAGGDKSAPATPTSTGSDKPAAGKEKPAAPAKAPAGPSKS